MLSLDKLSLAQSSTYYEQDSYYQQQVGKYYGRLTEELNLDDLDHHSFQNLLRGIDPNDDSKNLTVKRKKDSVPAFDFTLSPSKSISLALEIAEYKKDDVLKNQILDSHHAAVDKTLDYLEKNHIFIVKTTNKVKRKVQVDKLLAAEFLHDTNRFLEPHLHTHSLIFNFTKREGDKRFCALDSPEFLGKDMPFVKNIGAYYRNLLKEELSQKGFDLTTTNKEESFFEMTNIPEPAIKALSVRRQKIEEEAKKIRKKFPKMSKTKIYQEACLRTRVAKKKNVNRDEVRDININLISKYADIEKLHKDLKPDIKNVVNHNISINPIEIDKNQVLNIINLVQRELKKKHRTPLNVAIKSLNKMPNNNIHIDDLIGKVKTKEKHEQNQIITMNDLLVNKLQVSQKNTQTLIKNLKNISNDKDVKLKLEEKLENERPSDRTRAFKNSRREPDRIEQTEQLDNRDATRTITEAERGRGRGADESERHDDNQHRIIRRDQEELRAAIREADRAGNKQYEQAQNRETGVER